MESIKQDISKLYTIKEYAKIMGVKPRTVYYWIDDRKVNVVKISGKRFIKLSA